jgi:collagen type VII alpha
MFSFIQSRIYQIIFIIIFIATIGFIATQPIIPQNFAGLLTKDSKPVSSQSLIVLDKGGNKEELNVSPNKDGKFATSFNFSLLDIVFNKIKDVTICAKDRGVIIDGTISCVPVTTIATTDSLDTLKSNPDKIKTSFTPSDVSAFQQPSFTQTAKDNGVSSSVIYNLNGKDGQAGLDGFNGASGINGQNGINGSIGAQGTARINGINGQVGASGSNGATGPTGAQGIQGQIGATGPTGAQGIQGLTGATGAVGATGLTGATGPQGIQGQTGAAGSDGIQGIQGIQGLTGLTGLTGPQGLTGAMGLTGATGSQGVQGLTGAVGATGTQGSTGDQGIQGLTGLTGAIGPQGIQGTAGVLSVINGANVTGSLSSGNLTLGWTGQLSIVNGGTGANTANDALNNLLPNQFSNSGKVLATDGTNPSWVSFPSAPITSVFGRTGAVVASNGDYTTSQVTEGTNLYYTNARGIGSTLTGYTSGAGTVSATDSILGAIQKLNGNQALDATNITGNTTSINTLTTGLTATNTNLATANTNLATTNTNLTTTNTNLANLTTTVAGKENALTFTGNGLFSRGTGAGVNTITGTTCGTTGQVLSWNGTTFACSTSTTGTLTSIASGGANSGITIGGTASDPTVSISGLTATACIGTQKLTWSGTALSCDTDIDTGITSLTAVGSVPNANGGSISGTALTLQPADLNNPGLITATSQTIGGLKTFNSTSTDFFNKAFTGNDIFRIAPNNDTSGTQFVGTLSTANLSAARTWTLPDSSGTIAVGAGNGLSQNAAGVLELGSTLNRNTTLFANGFYDFRFGAIKKFTVSGSFTEFGNETNTFSTFYAGQVAIGNNNSFSGLNSNIALGNSNIFGTASGEAGVFGFNNSLNTTSSYIIGNNITNNTSNTIEIGTTNATKITIDNIGRLTLRGPLSPNGVDGNTNQVLISQGSGAKPIWSNISSLVPATTNTLTLSGSSLTSNVNGVSSGATIPLYTGSTPTIAGLRGLVNEAAIGQQGFLYTGAGTWISPTSAFSGLSLFNINASNGVSNTVNQGSNYTLIQGLNTTTTNTSGQTTIATVSNPIFNGGVTAPSLTSATGNLNVNSVFDISLNPGQNSVIPGPVPTTLNIGNNLFIGDSSIGGNPDLLVLDRKNLSTPLVTTQNGAMYYNTFDSKFKCYEANTWKDCITTAPTTTNILGLSGNTLTSNVNGISGTVSLLTTNVTEGTNLYYTNARGIASNLTGYTSGGGTVSATDSILGAIQKINGNQVLDATNIGTLTTTVAGKQNTLTAGTGIGIVGNTISNTGVMSIQGASSIGLTLTPTTATTGVATLTLGGTLAVANGGTGSTTQNFVDITTNQASIAGNKTFTGSTTVSGLTAGAIATSGNFSQTGATTFSTGTGAVSLNGATTITTGNSLTFKNTANTFGTSLVAGANTANLALTLPIADGTSGQLLTTNGSGVLSFSTALTSTNGFVQGGNSFGALANLGTNDTNILSLNTSGTSRFQLQAASATLQGQTATTISSLSTLDLNSFASSALRLGSNATTGSLTLGGSAGTGTIDIGNSSGPQLIQLGVAGAGAKVINIGTSAVGNAVRIGNTTGATSLALSSGTGGTIYTSTATTGLANNFVVNSLSTGSGLILTSTSSTLNSSAGLLFVANQGASTSGSIFRVDSNSSTVGFAVLANGNVGVGTATPGSLLSIGTNTTLNESNTARINSTNSEVLGLVGVGAVNVNFYNSTTPQRLATIQTTPNVSGGDLSFWTNPTTNTGVSERVRITASGLVGIGTSTPTQNLTIGGGLGVSGFNPVSSQGAYLQWNRSVGDGQTWLLNQRGGGTGGINFGNVSNTNVATVNAFLSDAGNLGLGTTAPATTLQVAKDSAYNIGTSAGLAVSNKTSPLLRVLTGYDSGNDLGYIQSTNEGIGYKSLILNPNGGNVGIGTITASNPLTVGGAGAGGLNIVSIYDSTQNQILGFASGASGFLINSQNNGLRLATNNVDRLTLTGTGNVGIGTANPGQPLEVAGNIFANNGALIGQFAAGGVGTQLSSRNSNYNFGSSAAIDAAVTNGTAYQAARFGALYPNTSFTQGFIQVNRQNANGTYDNFGTFNNSNGSLTTNFLSNSGGTTGVTLASGGGSWASISDARRKSNVLALNASSPTLAKIDGLNPVSYDLSGGNHEIGLIAQDVLPFFPELVTTPDDVNAACSATEAKGCYKLSYDRFGVIAIEGVKELNNKIKSIEDKNTAQDIAIAELSAKVIATTTGSGLTDAQVDAKLSTLGLAKLAGDQTFTGEITFSKDTVFKSDVDVIGDLGVGGKLILGKDTVNTTKVLATTTEVKVLFTTPYLKTPVVTASRVQASTDVWDVNEYRVVDITTTGFTIQMKVAPAIDTKFDYAVFGSK